MKDERTFYILSENTNHYSIKNRIDYIKEKIEMAPSSPGCYLWKDAQQQILYIGKSIKLRNRLKSYLNPANYKSYILLQKIYDVEWMITNTANEALILEDNLIKKYQPPFNVRLKDDKRYPFLCITITETYPRIIFTRRYKKDGNLYFGPYTDARFARQLLHIIHKTFPIRKVNQELPLKTPKRPCMNYFIKRCLAPCQGNVNVEEYRKIVDEIILFLEGRKELLEEVIIKRMYQYSEKMEYEKAAIYRDILIQLKQHQEKQNVIKPDSPDEDIIYIAINKEFHQALAIVLEFRNSKLLNRKSFSLYCPPDIDLKLYKDELFSSFLREYYLHFVRNDNFPAKITIPAKIEGIEDLENYLKEKFNYTIKIISKIPTALLEIVQKNAELLLKEKILGMKNKLKREALKQISEMLNLNKLPQIIECYDISHFAGKEIVGSGVRFINGEPHPSSYRHYIIKSINDIHDPAAIYEILYRRFERLKKENKTFPDLIIIDGGITQVNAAHKALREHNVNMALIGLAKKNEEIYFPENSKPVQFDKNSKGMLLLRQIRDETHRFAITHQQKRMRKRLFRHILDNIKGIGPEKKKLILKDLKDKSLNELQYEELIAIEGIGEKLAKKILNFIEKAKND